MESFYAGILPVAKPHTSPNTKLMLSRATINRSIVIAFMVVVGLSLAYAVNNRSFLGIVLSLTSLGAGVYFLYLLARANEQFENEEAG